MKPQIIRKLFFILIPLSFLSCESMISDVDAPTTEPKLVVHCYLRPNSDSVVVYVNQSQPLFSSRPIFSYEPLVVMDATVKISDGNFVKTLDFDIFRRRYFSTEMEIEAGKTYWLTVESALGTVRSHCTLPAKDPPQIEILSVENNPGEPNEKRINFRFRDGVGEGDFYRVTARSFQQYGERPEDGYLEDIWMQMGEEFITDKFKDGDFYVYRTGWIQAGFFTDRVVDICVSITDEPYFNYHRSVFNFDSGNPFSEPSPVYTNIESGLGVFAGYSSSVVQVNLGKMN